jgi:hypothetical protein
MIQIKLIGGNKIMSEQVVLKELLNSQRVIGTLKEMNLERKQNKKDPSKMQIQGNIVVMSEVAGKVHEHRIELFAFTTSKLAKGYETVMKEYKAADVVGKENATRVQVQGNLDINDYMNQEQKLVTSNRNRGVFVNRIDDPSVQDEALLQAELIITGVRPATDKEGVETGEYKLEGFTVGYNGTVIELKNMIVGEDLADVITEHYEVGATGKLTFAVNNYVEVIEGAPKENDEAAGFGMQVDLDNQIKKYVRELRVVGGFPPYYDERAYSEEQIEFAKKTRALKLQEVKNAVPATPPTGQGGFGVNGQGNAGKPADPFAGGGQIDISDDDLPF